MSARISLQSPSEILVSLVPSSARDVGKDGGDCEEACFAIELGFPVSVQSLPPADPQQQGKEGHTAPLGHCARLVESRFAFCIDAEHALHTALKEQNSQVLDTTAERALKSLYCASCNALLLREGTLRRVLPLPSPFWYELADMWICHDDFKCRSEMANKSPADLRPRAGDCLFADHHLMLHSPDLVPGAIAWSIRDDLDQEGCGQQGNGDDVQNLTHESPEHEGREGIVEAGRREDERGSGPGGGSAGIERLSSSASTTSSVASFSPLKPGRLWQEVKLSLSRLPPALFLSPSLPLLLPLSVLPCFVLV
jgi:hypothetical protein